MSRWLYLWSPCWWLWLVYINYVFLNYTVACIIYLCNQCRGLPTQVSRSEFSPKVILHHQFFFRTPCIMLLQIDESFWTRRSLRAWRWRYAKPFELVTRKCRVIDLESFVVSLWVFCFLWNLSLQPSFKLMLIFFDLNSHMFHFHRSNLRRLVPLPRGPFYSVL